MKIVRLITILAVSALLLVGNAAAQVVFKLKPINLTNGWKVSGTITTDGATGPLAPSNILDWNLKVVQTVDMVWTEKDSNGLSISGVSTDGKKIHVATSPDGVQDGGTLYFGRGGGGGRIPTNAVLADFTQLSYNLGYGFGGIAGWQDELGGLNYVGLNQKNNTQYHAASALAGRPNVFRISVPTLATSPILMTMFGTLTTDGTIGALLPQNIIAWTITARNQDITNYSNANSAVIAATGVSSDGTLIKVDHAGGQFLIGIAGRRPTFVTLADFTDPTVPNGFANYYIGTYGVMGDKAPLVGDRAKTYTVASK
jgi:hypothetical protein